MSLSYKDISHKENKSAYLKAYNREKRVRISLNLSNETEIDIIEAIERAGKGNKQAGIKKLIRKGIKYEDQLKRRQQDLKRLT